MKTLSELVASHRVVITTGSGGVGKTTVAASVALWGALQGRRTVVMTIDPARRLATSLGLSDLPNTPQAIAPTLLAPLGGRAGGSLAAMMLDQKGAWDALVERHAPADAREKILNNTFYQHLSQSFAGSHEYMAIEQLCLLADSGEWDLIVVDTPPTRHALDFLEAPQRIDDFLDRKVIQWFVKPYFSAGWSAFQAVNRTASFLLKKLEQATGVAALVQISEFFASMSGLFENFQPRIKRAYEVLRGAQTAFVLVAAPEEQVLGDADYLSTKMEELRMPLRGVVLNRVHAEHQDAPDAVAADVELDDVLAAVTAALDGDATAARALAENFIDYQTLARGEQLRMEQFRDALPPVVPVVVVPNFAKDVHDLTGLASMHQFLFDRGPGAA